MYSKQQMNLKKLFLILFVSIATVSCSSAKSEFIEQVDNKNIENIVNLAIEKIYKLRISDEFAFCGNEYKDARRYSFLDINNDNQKDLIVFIVFERLNCGSTGSDSHKYLLVATNNNDSYTFHSMTNFRFGGETIQTDFISKTGNNLKLSILTYGFNDPMCCPSKKSTIKIPINTLNKDWPVVNNNQ